jgi:AmmeMemoRadiSam system protein B
MEENAFVLRAVIGPHAGLRWSGANAAYAYANVKDPNQFDRVVILGPSHKMPLDFVVTTECDEWETPLGNLKVDKQAVQELLEFPKNNPKYFGEVHYQTIDKRHEENEHSLEMHLPYIRKVFESRMENPDTDIKIVPLMVGALRPDSYQAYAKSLVGYFQDPRTLFVVSSDFCHWGKRFRFTHKFEGYTDERIH